MANPISIASITVPEFLDSTSLQELNAHFAEILDQIKEGKAHADFEALQTFHLNPTVATWLNANGEITNQLELMPPPSAYSLFLGYFIIHYLEEQNKKLSFVDSYQRLTYHQFPDILKENSGLLILTSLVMNHQPHVEQYLEYLVEHNLWENLEIEQCFLIMAYAHNHLPPLKLVPLHYQRYQEIHEARASNQPIYKSQDDFLYWGNPTTMMPSVRHFLLLHNTNFISDFLEKLSTGSCPDSMFYSTTTPRETINFFKFLLHFLTIHYATDTAPTLNWLRVVESSVTLSMKLLQDKDYVLLALLLQIVVRIKIGRSLVHITPVDPNDPLRSHYLLDGIEYVLRPITELARQADVLLKQEDSEKLFAKNQELLNEGKPDGIFLKLERAAKDKTTSAEGSALFATVQDYHQAYTPPSQRLPMTCAQETTTAPRYQ